ncbi:hypothetical protein [Angustibacter luteus]|uniref:Uncharacterized protein n=1 Tax=Angustibacter luteus TaxID=658456 RepID=A0ABW1JK76_9ACTN
MSLNTTPRTWVTGEVVTAAMNNTEIRDALAGIQAGWTSYTPAWTAGANPVIGNGSIAGAYLQVGKRVDFRIDVTMGSTTTYGSGQWRLSLPTTPVARIWRWLANCYDASASGYYGAWAAWLSSGPYAIVWAPATTAGNNDRAIGAASPFTWATGDVLSVNGTYENA